MMNRSISSTSAVGSIMDVNMSIDVLLGDIIKLCNVEKINKPKVRSASKL